LQVAHTQRSMFVVTAQPIDRQRTGVVQGSQAAMPRSTAQNAMALRRERPASPNRQPVYPGPQRPYHLPIAVHAATFFDALTLLEVLTEQQPPRALSAAFSFFFFFFFFFFLLPRHTAQSSRGVDVCAIERHDALRRETCHADATRWREAKKRYPEQNCPDTPTRI